VVLIDTKARCADAVRRRTGLARRPPRYILGPSPVVFDPSIHSNRRLHGKRSNQHRITVCPLIVHRSLTGLTTFVSSGNDTLEVPHPFPNPRAHVEFYRVFKHEADEYDKDFINRHHDQATTTLIFVSSPLCPRSFKCQSQPFFGR
jgi:hypothetical protein